MPERAAVAAVLAPVRHPSSARPTVRLTPRRSALAASALAACTWAAAPVGAQRDTHRDAEPAAVRDARSAQRNFEFTRRVRLPPAEARSDDARRRDYYSYGGACPVRIGRMCWFDDNDEGAPPPEPGSVREARLRLLDQLARAAAADSASDWVAGQRVRYLLEARRPGDALAAATACGGSGNASIVSTWCLGLRGVVLHVTHRAGEAAAAFDSADALRTAAERCAWYDVSPWLESGAGKAYRRLACGSPERAHWESRFWRLAQPFWMLGANDLRNEWNARRVMGRVYGAGANTYGMSWGDDLAEIDLRYGWPTGWSARQDGAALSLYALGNVGNGVTGHEPAPSYDFVPRGAALAPERTGVADVPDGAWTLRPSPSALPTAMRYAPGYAGGGVGTPTHQLARFRRGDTALVVGAYDAARDSLWSEGRTPPRLSAALLVLDDTGAVAGADRRDSAGRAGVLVARVPGALGRDRFLVGLELLQHDSVHTPDGRHVLGRALRARAPWHPLSAGAELSDLLLLRHSPGPTPAFTAALDSAAGSADVRRGGTVGVYWEQYGTRPTSDAAAPDTLVIAATRLTRGFRDRVADALRLGGVERPIALRFPDPGGPAVGRAIGLTWPDVSPGDYRLEVTRVPGTPGRRPATSALVVHLVDE